MGEQKKNKLDVWFSYAGAQKEFVKLSRRGGAVDGISDYHHCLKITL